MSGRNGMSRSVAGRRLRKAGLAISCTAVAMLVALVPQASARHAVAHSYVSSFAAPYGAPGGENFGASGVAVAEAGGYLYIENSVSGLPLEKYTADGTPSPFTDPEANSSTTITTPGAGGYRAPTVEVDNSGNPATDGRIYVISDGPGVLAFEPSGKRIGGNFPLLPGARDVGVEPGTGNLWVLQTGNYSRIVEYTPDGEPMGVESEVPQSLTRIAVNSRGDIYLAHEYNGTIYKLDPTAGEAGEVVPFTFGRDVTIDPKTDDLYVLRYPTIAQFGVGGSLLFEFDSPTPPPNTNGTPSIAIDGTSGRFYRLMGGNVEIFDPGATVVFPDATTGDASDFQPTSVEIHGVMNADGVATTDCYFEWGTSTSYEQKTTCAEGKVFSDSAPHAVSAELTGLVKGVTYHYRLAVDNGSKTIAALDRTFTPSTVPSYSDEHVTDVHSDSVVLRGAVNPEGAATQFHFEIGTGDCALGGCTSTPVEKALLGVAPQLKSYKVTGLEQGTTYHYRLVADNQSGSSQGGDFTFTTFPITQLPPDPCPNAHVRQQTSAALLLDCRAYELTSTGNAGGYDVESDLVSGQSPFEGHPRSGKVLYSVHEGAIPGLGNPTNRGLDPYLATRGEGGWSTRYVGIPSNNPFAGGPFASNVLEADESLDAFAFGGKEICAPCFGDGSINIPLRLPDESLIQGISGSQGPKAADPAGEIHKYFSGDGSHLIFGTTTKLESAGNEGGDVTIYSRNIDGGPTEVVSTMPDGSTMTGAGIAELDVSRDGSRVIVAKKVSTDAAGNEYWHPYMHIAGSADSVDLAPSTTTGVLYAGMTADGSRAFFTSKDPLALDGDSSADLYEAAVDTQGGMSLSLLSTGATPPVGSTDECDPAANADGNNWNAVGPASTNSCGVVAIAGGGGLASGDGTIYFLSPEALDGSGAKDQPNLFVVRHGSAPAFVATLEPDNPLVRDAVQNNEKHVYGDFQITPDGRYAAFASTLRLTGFDSGGFYEVFRNDIQSHATICVSCNPTNARAVGSSTLPSGGLGLADDGTVFFNSADAIAPRDLDDRLDAYEFEIPKIGPSDGVIQLISTGVSPSDSSLLGISADGVDAFFYTLDTLVQQDENGDLVKIYDARAGGGFAYVPPRSPCKASDECHGPGTATPQAPEIRTIRGTGGNEAASETPKPACKPPKVRKGKKCVKRAKHQSKRRHTNAHKRG